MADTNRERGFTAIEMVIVLFILVTAAGLVFEVAKSLAVSYRTGETKIQVEENLRAGMTFMTRELRQARQNNLMVQLGGFVQWPAGDTIVFEHPADIDGNGNVLNAATGIVEYAQPIKYEFDSANKQIIRKQDLNINGIAEASVPGEIRTICNNVSDVEFYFPSVDMTEIRVTVTIERPSGQDIIKHTLREQVVPRN